MKKIVFSAVLLLSALMVTGAPKGNKTVKLKVIETSDVHSYFFPWDFTEGKVLKGSLARANTYIKKERKKYVPEKKKRRTCCGRSCTGI